MAKVIPGRFTAQTDEAFVVFIIGMRVNTLQVRKTAIEMIGVADKDGTTVPTLTAVRHSCESMRRA